jgi:hypothetical protein
VALTLVLFVFGVGIGFLGDNPKTSAILVAIWLIVTQWLSAGVGGFLTGRLRHRWLATHEHEVFFRDTAHGLAMWAVATVAVALVGTGAMGRGGAAHHPRMGALAPMNSLPSPPPPPPPPPQRRAPITIWSTRSPSCSARPARPRRRLWSRMRVARPRPSLPTITPPASYRAMIVHFSPQCSPRAGQAPAKRIADSMRWRAACSRTAIVPRPCAKRPPRPRCSRRSRC